MKFMNNTTCRLTIMLLFPLAGLICGGNANDRMQETSSSATLYPTGKEPPSLKQKNAKPSRLFQSPYMKGVTLVDYAIQMTIDTEQLNDGTSSKGSGTWSSSSSSGTTKYMPRLSITAKNKPLPESCLLVIEYFSQEYASKSKCHKECVEHISLPDIGKGQSVTVDASGVGFYKWEYKSTSSWGDNNKHNGGIELYGVIVSLFKDDKLLIQMCSPQALNKECSAAMSAPLEYKDNQPRHYIY